MPGRRRNFPAYGAGADQLDRRTCQGRKSSRSATSMASQVQPSSSGLSLSAYRPRITESLLLVSGLVPQVQVLRGERLAQAGGPAPDGTRKCMEPQVSARHRRNSGGVPRQEVHFLQLLVTSFSSGPGNVLTEDPQVSHCRGITDWRYWRHRRRRANSPQGRDVGPLTSIYCRYHWRHAGGWHDHGTDHQQMTAHARHMAELGGFSWSRLQAAPVEVDRHQDRTPGRRGTAAGKPTQRSPDKQGYPALQGNWWWAAPGGQPQHPRRHLAGRASAITLLMIEGVRPQRISWSLRRWPAGWLIFLL